MAGLSLVKADSINDVVQEHISESDKTFLGTLDLAKWYISVPDEEKVQAQDQRPHLQPILGS